MLHPAKWPKWYMYMRMVLAKHDIHGAHGNPNVSGRFTLTLSRNTLHEQYRHIKAHGGSFVVQSKKWPDEYL